MFGVIMVVKAFLLPLFLLLTSVTDVCPQNFSKEAGVNVGEMVPLFCPGDRGNDHGDANVIWTSYTTQKMDLTNMPSAEQRQMGMLVHGRSLVILNASVNHQGNYSCSLGLAHVPSANIERVRFIIYTAASHKGAVQMFWLHFWNTSGQVWFRLTVHTREFKSEYPQTCFKDEACILECPDVNIPDITSNGIIWHKEGESLQKDIAKSYFSSVEDNDRGVYTCTRSYLYHDQIYNMTLTVVLKVQPNEPLKTPEINMNDDSYKSDTIYVDLGSPKVINCKAVTYLEMDELFWFSGKSDLETNSSFPVFYNTTRENNAGEIKITASLVFKKVLEEDLSKNYTCKLQSASRHRSVTITLAQKPTPRPSYVPLALSFVGVVVVMVLTVVIYVRFKINITLFLRDTLRYHSSTSDGKSYDAFLMCYKSDTDAGLDEDDRKWLESVLEEKFGYSLCLYDRDVLPGKAVAEAVLDCVEQSRAVVLVPTSPDLGPGSGLLSAIHAALVERQTRLVFIQTETTEVSTSASLPEALQLLREAGDCVMWKGISSMPASSSFWKQLRYYLPAPQHAPNTRLLPQTI